jgi:hypothetical protein
MFRLIKLVFLLVFSGSLSVFSQNVKGVVKDATSRLPISNVQIITLKATVLTNSKGEFILSSMKLGDPIAVRIMGYETVELKLKNITDTMWVYLKQAAIVLNEVQIYTNRNYKLDSLKLRKEYAGAFVYKGPNFSDMFIEKAWRKDEYIPSFTNPRSTASMVSLNLLHVASLFGKKKVQNTRLKETLLRDEELNYVDHVFSNDKVESITGLNGEQLIKFMDIYRPTVLSLKKMTGYELTVYIKKSYEEFMKKPSPLLSERGPF